MILRDCTATLKLNFVPKVSPKCAVQQAETTGFDSITSVSAALYNVLHGRKRRRITVFLSGLYFLDIRLIFQGLRISLHCAPDWLQDLFSEEKMPTPHDNGAIQIESSALHVDGFSLGVSIVARNSYRK